MNLFYMKNEGIFLLNTQKTHTILLLFQTLDHKLENNYSVVTSCLEWTVITISIIATEWLCNVFLTDLKKVEAINSPLYSF